MAVDYVKLKRLGGDLPLANLGVLTEVNNTTSGELGDLHGHPLFAVPGNLRFFLSGSIYIKVREGTEANEDGGNEERRELGSPQLAW